MIRIRFDAKLRTHSDKGTFPSDAIAAVYFTNHDKCSHKATEVDNKGNLSVDFNMEPFDSKAPPITDRIKMHFFFRDNKDEMLKPVCAGHMKLVDLADHVADGKEFTVGSNFNTNKVTMKFTSNAAHAHSMHEDLLRLHQNKQIVPSVLGDSKRHFEVIQKLDQHIKDGLGQNTIVSKENGGTMFQSVFTAHMMEDEATLYTLYHEDFNQPENVPPFQCMYMLCETLNHLALTPDDVMRMDLKGQTDFIASYAQAPMRSASVVPYTMDLSMTDDPREFTRKRSMLSEVFKRPYSLPNQIVDGRAALLRDDCEGLATFMQNATNHLGYLYTNHQGDFKQNNILAFNTFMRRYFPRDLFGQTMPQQYQNKVMGLALFLGSLVANKIIHCKITLVSANAMAMDGPQSGQMEIQGHACACMICENPSYAVIMEGTACMVDEQSSKRLKIGDRFMTLSEIANSLSMAPPFNTFMETGLRTKIGMHFTHSRGSFYRTAFCQNDELIGTQINNDNDTNFGVDMEHLADEGLKVYMPVTGKHLEKGELEALKEYVCARRSEIHMPLVDHDELRAGLKWAPMVPFKGCKELIQGRPYYTCLVHVLADEKNPLDTLLKRANEEAEAFNTAPGNSSIGVMRAFASMDGVSKVFHIYSDDTKELQERLQPNRK